MKIKQTQNPIRNLILDLGVVLIDLTPQRCLEMFKEYGVQNVEHLLDPQYKFGLFLEFEAGKITAGEFREKLRETSGVFLTNQQMDEAWNSFLGEVPTYKLELLEELRKHFNLFLLSNTNAIHWEWVEKKYPSCYGHSFGEYFKKLYLSYDLKLVKPDREIFQYVLNDAAIKAEETFFIDDAIANCRAANLLGIQTYTPLPGEDWRHLFSK